ncbi:MAG: hypothetical protein ACYTGV_05600 [Planctomycetota bacterium]
MEDRLDLRLLAQGREPTVALSALTGEGLNELSEEVGRAIAGGQTEAVFRVPAGAGKLLAFLADRGTILDKSYGDGVVSVRVRLGGADLARAGRMVEELSPPISAEE